MHCKTNAVLIQDISFFKGWIREINSFTDSQIEFVIQECFYRYLYFDVMNHCRGDMLRVFYRIFNDSCYLQHNLETVFRFSIAYPIIPKFFSSTSPHSVVIKLKGSDLYIWWDQVHD